MVPEFAVTGSSNESNHDWFPSVSINPRAIPNTLISGAQSIAIDCITHNIAALETFYEKQPLRVEMS